MFFNNIHHNLRTQKKELGLSYMIENKRTVPRKRTKWGKKSYQVCN